MFALAAYALRRRHTSQATTITKLNQNIVTMSNTQSDSLTPSEEEVQKPASAPSVRPRSFHGCTPELASGSLVSTLSSTSENKPEGVNLPATAEGGALC